MTKVQNTFKRYNRIPDYAIDFDITKHSDGGVSAQWFDDNKRQLVIRHLTKHEVENYIEENDLNNIVIDSEQNGEHTQANIFMPVSKFRELLIDAKDIFNILILKNLA